MASSNQPADPECWRCKRVRAYLLKLLGRQETEDTPDAKLAVQNLASRLKPTG